MTYSESHTRSIAKAVSWAGYYSNRNHGDDYLLIMVTPLRLEMVSPAHGMAGEPWHPVMLDFAAPPAINR